MRIRHRIFMFIFSCLSTSAQAQEPTIGKEDFKNIQLGYPGLEAAHTAFKAEKYEEAGRALLTYYRNRTGVRHPEFNGDERERFAGKPIAKADQEKADNALEHKFQPQKGYGFYDYGKDINWQYWPVKDNEVRWQLHRMYWWQPMGLAYRSSGNEKYAREWIFQFRDWVKKNPLGLSEDNDRYAWRPLEVSERVQSLPGTFSLFIHSPHFTPAFLLEFLNSYHQQANYIPPHYSAEGNHLLFEAQRVLFAGSFFPELKNAEEWRKSGIDVLNREIGKQVYPDGMQFELSPAYHVASIDIFLRAYNSAKMAGLEKEFPGSYIQTIEKMVLAAINWSYPDYDNPMFGDSWSVEKNSRIKQFRSWAAAFPQNDIIRYFATDGREGKQPGYLSKGLTTAGFYTFRNGWGLSSTVMILKAGPPGKFHAQPDNGTFELWVKGRNFMPDAGCYVYSGDAEIMKMREWYRQSRVHQTLTLDDQNMVITKAALHQWKTSGRLDVLSYSNPSYDQLRHKRSVLFIGGGYFLVIDQAIGHATGKLGVHFQLREDSRPLFDPTGRKVHTRYDDGNNLLIQSFTPGETALREEDGKVSYQYRKETTRPAFVFEQAKPDGQPRYFITLVCPYQGAQPPRVSITEGKGHDLAKDALELTVTVNGKKRDVSAKL